MGGSHAWLLPLGGLQVGIGIGRHYRSLGTRVGGVLLWGWSLGGGGSGSGGGCSCRDKGSRVVDISHLMGVVGCAAVVKLHQKLGRGLGGGTGEGTGCGRRGWTPLCCGGRRRGRGCLLLRRRPASLNFDLIKGARLAEGGGFTDCTLEVFGFWSYRAFALVLLHCFLMLN